MNNPYSRAIFAALTMTALFVVGGCRIVDAPTDSATLILNFGKMERLSSRTITVEYPATTVTDILIQGDGPSGQTVSETFAATQTEIALSLLPGAWTFVVQGLNADGSAVLEWSGSVYLSEGLTEVVEANLTPLSGDATMVVVFDWSADTLDVPEASYILATGADLLTPVSNATASDLDASAATLWDSTNGSARFEAVAPSGHYYLSTTLDDGGDGKAPWSVTSSVQLYAGMTTTATVTLGAAGLTISITLDAQEPIGVTLDGVESPLTDGSMSLTATVGETGTFVYHWYLDGALDNPAMTTNGATATITGLAIGRYSVSVVVSDSGNRLGSAYAIFDVTQ